MNKSELLCINKFANKQWLMFACKPNGKAPMILEWQNTATNDIDTLLNVVASKGCNIGILTGKKSGLFVIDIDMKNGKNGLKSVLELEKTLGELPETFTVETPSGGLHYYYSYPTQYSLEKLGNKVNIIDGVDVRSDGGYVIAPPSSLDGVSYKIVKDIKLASIPTEWINYIYSTQFKPTRKQATLRNGNSIIITLRKKFELPDKIADGERNDVLLKYGGQLISKDLSMEDIKAELYAVNTERCTTPLSTEEIESTILKSLNGYHDKHELTKNKDMRELGDSSEKIDLSWVQINPKTGSATIDELKYVKYYIKEVVKGNLFYMNANFWDKNLKIVPLSDIESDMLQEIGAFVSGSLMKKVNGIIEILKREVAYQIEPKDTDITNIYSIYSDRILKFNHETGTYQLDFIEKRTTPVLNALRIDFNPEILEQRNSYEIEEQAPYFNKWLTGLLGKVDRDIFQQFIGYCLIPSTKCQVAMQLEGDAGVGKSRIYDVLQTLLGSDKISMTDLTTLEDDKYIASTISNKLVIYDDDLKVQSLKDTGMLKTLISANDAKIRVQEKYERSFTLKSYAKVICCGNHLLSSLYDRSEGLWRRFVLLRCLSRDKTRETITYDKFKEEFEKEKDYIFLWALSGLEELIRNNWVFNHTERIAENRLLLQEENDPMKKFTNRCENLKITGNPKDVIPMQWLYQYFDNWCRLEGMPQVKERTFYKSFAEEEPKITKAQHKCQGVNYRCYAGVQWLTDDEVVEEVRRGHLKALI